ncbi:MAG: dihydropteroate synthase [Candidatus Eisenbacteria bacterium]|nr:dihydropteroate synthase [Candidatus Eisenbacteria bacterium]
MTLGAATRVMGILNVTPDSFSDGGRHLDPEKALEAARAMVAAGADILDIGGESTRPGSESVPPAEQIRRILPVIRGAAGLGTPISVDTTSALVARAAIDAGACVVNDISGLRFEPALADIVREAGAGLILMHSRGTPRDMQHDPSYHDVMMEVVAGLGEACRRAEERGVGRNRTVVDPGIGFGKTIGHNLELLRHLDRLVAAGRPVLIGVSRKSFISRILDVGIEDRLEGSLAAAVSAVLSGVHLVRVHDVVATVRAVRVADAIRNGSPTT